MGIVDITKGNDYSIGIWKLEEDEDESKLKEIVGGNLFPGLDKISNPKRRLEWLAARCLIREFGHIGLVLYHPTRRPFLAHSRSHLSISHSYPYVAVIISHSSYVGIDIESFERTFTQVADKYLSNNEKKWLDQTNNKKLALIWSAKEALYKLPGMEGLGGADMDIKPFEHINDKGKLKASIRLGGTIQNFNLDFYYLNHYNVVWVGCDPKTLMW